MIISVFAWPHWRYVGTQKPPDHLHHQNLTWQPPFPFPLTLSLLTLTAALTDCLSVRWKLWPADMLTQESGQGKKGFKLIFACPWNGPWPKVKWRCPRELFKFVTTKMLSLSQETCLHRSIRSGADPTPPFPLLVMSMRNYIWHIEAKAKLFFSSFFCNASRVGYLKIHFPFRHAPHKRERESGSSANPPLLQPMCITN